VSPAPCQCSARAAQALGYGDVLPAASVDFGSGHPVGSSTVRDLLHQLGYSLQSNAKVLEGAQHPDRNAQFGYINEQVRRHLRRGEPVASVDTKRKSSSATTRTRAQNGATARTGAG
jgi:Rhodopirellula transposase DDE domain